MLEIPYTKRMLLKDQGAFMAPGLHYANACSILVH